ncbi:MAG TPA: 4Fe-4S dicluster domain-containing protein [Spirochaetia bacterium]|nr:4Fe-4S dicluster domain-containing protein [Spirochaetia bacterium]
MDRALLREKDFDTLLNALRKDSVIYAPVLDRRDGTTAFSPVESSAEADFSRVNTRLSVKGLFFPQRERLLRFEGNSFSEEMPPAERFVVFGVRPCDARSLSWLDGVFLSAAREDPYFRTRRANGIVISMACDHPSPSCFCTSTGGSPYGMDGADLLVSRTGRDGELLFEAASARGRELLDSHGPLFQRADEKAAEERAAREQAARARMKTIDLDGIKKKLDAGMESPLWDELSASCLGCGVCAYLCPSCHCFDITDEKQGSRGIRVRSWDTCQFPRFTLHASGHNPRPRKKARLRQRVMHKFSYAVETAGTVYCSGCGRCVRACPVDLDIRGVLGAFKDLP